MYTFNKIYQGIICTLCVSMLKKYTTIVVWMFKIDVHVQTCGSINYYHITINHIV
jgi:hypothetical protein